MWLLLMECNDLFCHALSGYNRVELCINRGLTLL